MRDKLSNRPSMVATGTDGFRIAKKIRRKKIAALLSKPPRASPCLGPADREPPYANRRDPRQLPAIELVGDMPVPFYSGAAKLVA